MEPLAVEAWDAWFRWRHQGELRDLTIDSTWSRVADAIAVVEGDAAAIWSQRFADAFTDWQLLPDERLLCHAGTDLPLQLDGAPSAVLNAAAFVRAPLGAQPRLDRDRLHSAAALAVRLLDDALLSAPATAPGLRIGLIGVADALARLGLSYDSDPGRRQAREIVAALAEGCLWGATALAAERGGRNLEGSAPRWHARETPSELIADALRWGIRHLELTAVASQPRLAVFANNVANALDPTIGRELIPRYAALDGLLPAHGAGAIRLRVQPTKTGLATQAPAGTLATVAARAQIALRAEVQPWIDAPIDYPLPALKPPDRFTREHCVALAQRSGLPSPRWQLIDSTTPLPGA